MSYTAECPLSFYTQSTGPTLVYQSTCQDHPTPAARAFTEPCPGQFTEQPAGAFSAESQSIRLPSGHLHGPGPHCQPLWGALPNLKQKVLLLYRDLLTRLTLNSCIALSPLHRHAKISIHSDTVFPYPLPITAP